MAMADDFVRRDAYRRVAADSENAGEASIGGLAATFVSGLAAFIGLSLMIASLAGA